MDGKDPDGDWRAVGTMIEFMVYIVELLDHLKHPRSVIVGRGDHGLEVRGGREVQDALGVPPLRGLALRRARVPEADAPVD